MLCVKRSVSFEWGSQLSKLPLSGYPSKNRMQNPQLMCGTQITRCQTFSNNTQHKNEWRSAFSCSVTAGDFRAQPAELYVQLQQKHAKLKHPFAFRTRACLFISLCLGILLPDVYTNVTSEHISHQKLKRIGMHFEAVSQCLSWF